MAFALALLLGGWQAPLRAENAAPASTTRDVVIIGGGYGGLELARKLAKQPGVNPILVDLNAQHTMITRLAESAVSGASVGIPLGQLADGAGFRFVQGAVERISTKRKRVRLRGGQTIAYDALVVATGSRAVMPKDDRIAGLRRFALPLRTQAHADQIFSRIEALVNEAARSRSVKQQRKLLTFVVAGGGASGVEMAGELAEACRNGALTRRLAARRGLPLDSARYQQLDRLVKRASVTLIEKGKAILPHLDAPEQRAAREALKTLGVDVRNRVGVRKVTRRTIYLDDGSSFRAGMTIATFGVRGDGKLSRGRKAMPRTERGGWLEVDERLSVKGLDGVYAIGDMAGRYEKTAQEAQHQAQYLARALLGKRQGKRYRPFNQGQATNIGRRFAVSTITLSSAIARLFGRSHLTLNGRAGMLLKHVINLRHELPLRLIALKAAIRRRLRRWRPQRRQVKSGVVRSRSSSRN